MRSSPLPTLGALTGVLAACICAVALWPSGALADPANDFSLGTPTPPTGLQGGLTYVTINTAITAGTAETLKLHVEPPANSGIVEVAGGGISGGPAGPRSIMAGTSTRFTLSISSTTACGSYPVDVVGESSSHTHVVTVTLQVVGCDGFSISATNPSTLTVDQGQTASATVSTAVTKGSAQPVSLSVSGLPAGATASFSPSTVTTGGSSKLTVSTTTATPCGGSYTLTIIGRDKDLVWAKRTLPLQLTGCIVNGDFSNGLYGWSASDGVTVAADPKLGHVAQLTGTESIAQTFRAPASGGRLSLEFTNPAYGPWLVETPDGWVPRDNSFDCGALQLDDLTAPTGGLNVPVGSPLVAGHTYKLSAIHFGGARYFPSGNINCDAGPTTLAKVTIKPTT